MRKWMVAWAGACLVLCLPLTAARAEEDENLRELKQAERQIKELNAHAAELEADGQHDKAAEYRAKAKKLYGRIKRAQKRMKKERAKKHKRGGDLINTLEGLEHGIVALRKLGKKEEAAHLQEIAAGVRRRINGGNKKKRGGNERELAKHHVETLRLAMHAFQEAEKREWAEQIEHAIHARELGLEGRRDEEAIHMRKTAPSDGHLAELLHVAAKYYSEWGHPDRAERVAKLSAWFGHRWNDQKAGKKKRERAGRRERDREQGERRHRERDRRGPDDRMQAAMERIERLEERMNKVIDMLEKMHAEQRK